MKKILNKSACVFGILLFALILCLANISALDVQDKIGQLEELADAGNQIMDDESRNELIRNAWENFVQNSTILRKINEKGKSLNPLFKIIPGQSFSISPQFFLSIIMWYFFFSIIYSFTFFLPKRSKLLTFIFSLVLSAVISFYGLCVSLSGLIILKTENLFTEGTFTAKFIFGILAFLLLWFFIYFLPGLIKNFAIKINRERVEKKLEGGMGEMKKEIEQIKKQEEAIIQREPRNLTPQERKLKSEEETGRKLLREVGKVAQKDDSDLDKMGKFRNIKVKKIKGDFS